KITHVAIANYIYYQQRYQVLQTLSVANALYVQKFLLPFSLDPTSESKGFRERKAYFERQQRQRQQQQQQQQNAMIVVSRGGQTTLLPVQQAGKGRTQMV